MAGEHSKTRTFYVDKQSKLLKQITEPIICKKKNKDSSDAS